MKRILIAGFICCLYHAAWAATSSVLPTDGFTRRTYVSVSAGGSLNRVSGRNYLNSGTGWPNDHYASNSVSDQFDGFLAGGYAWERPNNWLPSYSVGLRYMYTSTATISGYLDQFSLPGFRNYNFTYDVQLLSLLIALKADLYRWHGLMPYVLLGAGVSNYAVSNYKEQATVGVTPRVSPAFAENAGNNIAYQLGLGVDYAIRENWLISLEGDYMSYGTVSTGQGVNYSTLTGINYDNELLKNKITATTLFLGATYFVG